MRWKTYWTLVYVANLVVPILFARDVVTRFGWFGVGLVVVAYWATGFYFIERKPFVVRMLVSGGIAVGLFQFMPIPQMFAGILGVSCGQMLEQGPSKHDGFGDLGLIGSFMATVITGGLLLILAMLIGLPFALRSMRAVVDERKPLGKAPVFDPEF